MIEPGSLARAIASLEGSGCTDALAILRLLQSTSPVAGMTVDQYAEELEPLSHATLVMHAACTMAQLRITQQRLAHVRAEMAQLGMFADARETPTEPAPPPSSTTGAEEIP